MGSKAFLFLGLFLAIFLIISSEVAARELAETSNGKYFFLFACFELFTLKIYYFINIHI